MGILNQIKSELLQLEGGKFQRLCDDWLFRKGYENINPIGMMETTDRVVRGTPDSLCMQSDGKYVFSEYTIQKDALAKKIENDISKCFDEFKTGIPIDKISEIIICYVGKLTTIEISTLRNLCYDKSVMLTLYGLDSIALSIQNSYPVLSEIYLSLSLDTGQLLSVEDFIARYGKNNFSTPIDNELLFSENLLSSATRTLETTNFLLVSGAAGLGKTLFSVSLVKRFLEENSSLKAICLFDKGADLTRDITAYFSEPGNYLIFVDDANRLDNRLDYLLHYLNDNSESRTFRIIATVRDYAQTAVAEKVRKYTNFQEQVLTPLTDDQIKELSEKLYGIKNPEYQKRIQEISCGNPRLALMASKIAAETNQIQSIQNVTSLYNDYFGENENVINVVSNNKLVVAACAVSFFRKIDKLNEQQMSLVEKSFGIQPEEFWELVDVLHNNEIVDLYENEVVKITDQVLSTYIFYVAVFDKKIIPFSQIVKDFYPNYRRTIVDSLNPVIRAFDQSRITANIRSEIKSIFEIYSENNNDESTIEFLNTFWFSLPTESLTFVAKAIQKMPINQSDWSIEDFEGSKSESGDSSLVSLLANFRYYREQEFKISFELLLAYLIKDKSSLGFVIRVMLERYNFEPDDWRYAYIIQKHVVDTLIDLMHEDEGYLFSRLFIVVANSFLQVEHRKTRWSHDSEIIITTFKLSPDEQLLAIRRSIFANLATLAVDPLFEKLAMDCFKEYVNRVRREGKDMAEADLPFIEKYFVKNLDKNNISHCMIMQNYCTQLESLGISFPKQWEKVFSNDIIELSYLLLEDWRERRSLDMRHEDYNQYRLRRLVEYFTGVSIETFVDFLKKCKVLNDALSSRERNYSIKMGLQMCLRALAKVASSIYFDLVSKYLEYDDYFEINPHIIVSDLFEAHSSKEVFSLLNSKEYKWKKLWLSAYFTQQPEESITKHESELLIKHISNTSSNEQSQSIEYLDKYRKVDSTIYRKVVSILVQKSKEDLSYAGPIGHIFNDHSTIFGKWFEEFHPDKELVFEAYLAAFNFETHWDYSGDALKILINERFDFLYKFIDQVYENERWPDFHTNMPMLDFLWERDNYIEEIEGYAKYLIIKDESSYRDRENIFSKILAKEENKDQPARVRQKKEFFRETIKRNAADIKYTCFIFNAAHYLGDDSRRELLGLFIDANPKFEDFLTLDNELSNRTWSGSKVPTLEREKKFLESLLPLFNSIRFLEHKSYAEKKIEDKLAMIEYEKKRDYLESR